MLYQFLKCALLPQYTLVMLYILLCFFNVNVLLYSRQQAKILALLQITIAATLVSLKMMKRAELLEHWP